MVRLYAKEAKFLTLVLSYFRDSMGLRPQDIIDHYRNSGDKRLKGFASVLYGMAGEIDRNSVTNDGMIETLVQQIYEKDPQHDGDLIELIVGVLGLEYTRNRLPSGAIEDLRKAILLPDELRKLKEKLQEKELKCACGHRFQDGELTTLSINREGVFIACARCRLPQYVVCFKKTGCQDLASIDERDLGRIRRAACHVHRQKTEESTEDPMSVQDALNRPATAFRPFTVGTRPQRPSTVPEHVWNALGSRSQQRLAGEAQPVPTPTLRPTRLGDDDPEEIR